MTHDEFQNNSSDTGTKVPMTHDELLAKLENYGYGGQLPLVALRAVVELHKPEHSIRGYRCSFDDEAFPCFHHHLIEKELG